MSDNFFDPASSADRYIKGRPYFHPHIIAQIHSTLALSWPLRLGLDIACGTGMSSRALKALAEQVIGIDSSQEMLKFAQPEPGIVYLHNTAESLAFAANDSVDIMTISQAFHWIDQQLFLKEAHRVLIPGSYLIIYDFHFFDMQASQLVFPTWFRNQFLAHFPRPPRNRIEIKNLHLHSLGMTLRYYETLDVHLEFTKEQLLAYLMSLSYVTARVEFGEESPSDAEEWLNQQLTSLFAQRTSMMLNFQSPIWYIQKDW